MSEDSLADQVRRLTEVAAELLAAIRSLQHTLASHEFASEAGGAAPSSDQVGEVATAEAAVCSDSEVPLTAGWSAPPPMPVSVEPGELVRTWFGQRGIRVQETSYLPPAQDPLMQLAVELGTQFDDLRKLHDAIRSTQAQGRGFSLSLEDAPPATIGRCVGFGRKLKAHGMLSNCWYDKQTKTLHGRPQQKGLVQNFFTGDWLELYVAHQCRSLLIANQQDFDMLVNLRVGLPNGQERELDIVCIVAGQPLWIEYKTGDYAAHLERLNRLHGELPGTRLLLVTLDLAQGAAQTIQRLHGVGATELAGLEATLQDLLLGGTLSQIGDGTGHAQWAAPAVTGVRLPLSPSALSSLHHSGLPTFLKKVGLRPMRDIRAQVLASLPAAVTRMSCPRTAGDLKNELHSILGHISRSQITDILSAVVRGGGLVDESGEAVTGWAVPFARLGPLSAEGLNECCRRAYLEAVLRAAPEWWDARSAGDEFAEATGCLPPTRDEIAAALARMRRAAAETTA